MREMILLSMLGLASTGRAGEVDELVARLLSTAPGEARTAIADEIVALGDSATLHDAVRPHLIRGPRYGADVPRGRLLFEHVDEGGLRHPYMILVPEHYDPAQRWPVRVDLHGGMGASEWTKLDGSWSPAWRESSGPIVIVPAGWWDSMWWEASQVRNLHHILSEVKRTWNVDENRVVLYGSSDGCTALFFHAFRNADAWCGFAGHVGSPDRLVRENLRPDGQMHLSNLEGQRFHLGYGERDPKCPLEHLTRYLELFQTNGAELEWFANSGQGHDLSITPEQERALGRFFGQSVRDPLPDRLSWSTERTDRYHRRAWLVIEELASEEREVDTTNVLPRWGTRIQRRGATVRARPWGRVEIERQGNTVRAETVGVDRFRILVSADEFDLARPITVDVDGERVFDERVTPSVRTLLDLFLVDEDRTKLFSAEILVDVAATSAAQVNAESAGAAVSGEQER